MEHIVNLRKWRDTERNWNSREGRNPKGTLRSIKLPLAG
jgi:hypothetical protein